MPVKPIINSQEIERVLILREKRSALKKQIEDTDNELAASESEIIKKLKSNADNASGFLLKLKTSQKRSIQWKEWFIRKVGKLAADRILARTKATTYIDLVIGAADEIDQRKAA